MASQDFLVHRVSQVSQDSLVSLVYQDQRATPDSQESVFQGPQE